MQPTGMFVCIDCACTKMQLKLFHSLSCMGKVVVCPSADMIRMPRTNPVWLAFYAVAAHTVDDLVYVFGSPETVHANDSAILLRLRAYRLLVPRIHALLLSNEACTCDPRCLADTDMWNSIGKHVAFTI